jgi:hypothetical protein
MRRSARSLTAILPARRLSDLPRRDGMRLASLSFTCSYVDSADGRSGTYALRPRCHCGRGVNEQRQVQKLGYPESSAQQNS